MARGRQRGLRATTMPPAPAHLGRRRSRSVCTVAGPVALTALQGSGNTQFSAVPDGLASRENGPSCAPVSCRRESSSSRSPQGLGCMRDAGWVLETEFSGCGWNRLATCGVPIGGCLIPPCGVPHAGSLMRHQHAITSSYNTSVLHVQNQKASLNNSTVQKKKSVHACAERRSTITREREGGQNVAMEDPRKMDLPAYTTASITRETICITLSGHHISKVHPVCKSLSSEHQGTSAHNDQPHKTVSQKGKPMQINLHKCYVERSENKINSIFFETHAHAYVREKHDTHGFVIHVSKAYFRRMTISYPTTYTLFWGIRSISHWHLFHRATMLKCCEIYRLPIHRSYSWDLMISELPYYIKLVPFIQHWSTHEKRMDTCHRWKMSIFVNDVNAHK